MTYDVVVKFRLTPKKTSSIDKSITKILFLFKTTPSIPITET